MVFMYVLTKIERVTATEPRVCTKIAPPLLAFAWHDAKNESAMLVLSQVEQKIAPPPPMPDVTPELTVSVSSPMNEQP